MLELKEIDLSKCFGCDHPDVRTDGTQYLAYHQTWGHVGPKWHVGTFSRQWWGLSMNFGDYRKQLDDAEYPDKTNEWLLLFEMGGPIKDNSRPPDERQLRKIRLK